MQTETITPKTEFHVAGGGDLEDFDSPVPHARAEYTLAMVRGPDDGATFPVSAVWLPLPDGGTVAVFRGPVDAVRSPQMLDAVREHWRERGSVLATRPVLADVAVAFGPIPAYARPTDDQPDSLECPHREEFRS